MPRGDKSAYTDKQKRQAKHIEESYENRGVSKEEAEARAWATVNKESGGGKLSGSGRKRSTSSESSRKASVMRNIAHSDVKTGAFEMRSEAAKKGWETRRKQA